jgi:hypothetical protein
MPSTRKLSGEDLSDLWSGHLRAGFIAREEYCCLHRPDWPNGWYDPIDHADGRPGSFANSDYLVCAGVRASVECEHDVL